MRIAILHTRVSGYMAASWRALKQKSDCELMIYVWPNQSDAPFDMSQFEDVGRIRNRKDYSNIEIEQSIRDFSPDLILTSGWIDKGYVKICRRLKKLGIPVVAGCDTQWTGSLRQKIACVTAPLHVRRSFDYIWVAGERQGVLARNLGYTGDYILDGLYACDWSSFASEGAAHQMLGSEKTEDYFLFVGRYVEAKGIDTLVEAYRQYCAQVDDPWPLICAGAGSLQQDLLDAGAEDRGFVQPSELPELMKNAAVFVLPSRFEPWGVVAQEAAASGLPLILSDNVGASVHLLRSNLNGYVFPAGSVESLAERLTRVHELPASERSRMGHASHLLSLQYTPKRWADVLTSVLRSVKKNSYDRDVRSFVKGELE